MDVETVQFHYFFMLVVFLSRYAVNFFNGNRTHLTTAYFKLRMYRWAKGRESWEAWADYLTCRAHNRHSIYYHQVYTSKGKRSVGYLPFHRIHPATSIVDMRCLRDILLVCHITVRLRIRLESFVRLTDSSRIGILAESDSVTRAQFSI